MTLLVDQLKRLTEARSDTALWETHKDIMRSYGFVRLLYGLTRYYSETTYGDPLDWIVHSSFPDGYTEDYLRKGYLYHDPTIRWVVNHIGACSLRTIVDLATSGTLTAQQMEVLAFDWQHGIRTGMAISFRPSHEHTRAGIALVADSGVSQDEVDAIWQEHGSSIEVLNEVMHLRLLSLPQTSNRRLTKRQLEVLRWVGDGKTMQDIATLMDLQPSTVEKHLRLARQSLGVETTAQAVLKASFL